MKKLMVMLLLTFAFSAINVGTVDAKTCTQKADVCYAKCDVRYSQNTQFDGAFRNMCKTGCTIAEGWCIVASWF